MRTAWWSPYNRRAGQAQVVYLTRPDDASMVESVIERTGTYRLIDGKLEEIGYVDEPPARNWTTSEVRGPGVSCCHGNQDRATGS
ncbi:hypothetical protein [Micromonospora echinofusca]|uniref:Uncharacterized protein n=1 Tax=Micromonospora echinofusca TaxID=47858 RepID=A0ABS3VNH9_MICEH|nr:hypothetical protein [Micromonospora echinofusca]MBO4206110.1 hypothetical protein [Micromonospora echinofusca]